MLCFTDNFPHAYFFRYPRLLSFGFPKHSKYKEFFDFNLLRQFEVGVQDILVHRRMREKSEICGKGNTREPKDVAIGAKKLIGLFAWMAGAFLISLIIMCLENLLALKQRGDLDHLEMKQCQENNELLLRFGTFMVGWDEKTCQDFLSEIENYIETSIQKHNK